MRHLSKSGPPHKAAQAPPAFQLQGLVQQALTLHQEGQFSKAQMLYVQVLAEQPDHFDALQLLGTLSAQIGQHASALDFLDQALRIQPDHAACHANRGNALKALKRPHDALASYARALALRPNYAQAFSNRGNVLMDLHRNEEALASFDQAIGIKPDHVEAYSNRGNVLMKLTRLPDAVDSFRRAIAIAPNYAKAHCNLGNALKAMGQLPKALASYARALELEPNYAMAHANCSVVLHELNRLDDALAACDRAIALDPAYAQAHSNRGNVLKALHRYEDAMVSYDQAIALQPDYAQAYSNRGISLQELNRFEEALQSYDKAIELAPNLESAYSNRGNVLRDLLRVDEALRSFDRAVELQPDFATAYWNKSLALLLAGDYAQGWALHEWRWKSGKMQAKARRFSETLWTGQEDIANASVLLHAEQGLGDIIQFCRYAALLKQRGARVILEAPKTLMPLLHSLQGVDLLVEFGQALPPFDFQCPLMSLPLACGTRIDSIPSAGAYLRAPEDKVRYWRSRLTAHTSLRVGLVWNGGFRPDQSELWSTNARRNIPLETISRALGPVRADFFSLQKGEPAESEIFKREHVFWPEGNFYNYANELHDFADTAALIANLDLVVAVDTSTAHLAAAMGKPTWILNRFDTCWRWLLDRNDSPWYDAVTLYRQDQHRSWEPVLRRVVHDLKQAGTVDSAKA